VGPWADDPPDVGAEERLADQDQSTEHRLAGGDDRWGDVRLGHGSPLRDDSLDGLADDERPGGDGRQDGRSDDRLS